ncbi:DUF4124 domain-containing protein [Alcanivorax sp. DP30]|uniref:DUF4124 domain-containing protein n=1 Tax=Alcanivorax sp. DP30 TaxID=2606217 RepID=UPI001F30881D|nr:DUF4124 domain-containing protein [Alcanivorax sp. DP30]
MVTRSAQWAMVLMVLLMPLTASAEIYRWKDENGNWQFGDRAPDTQHETMDVQGPDKLGQDENVQQIHQRLQRLRESEQTRQKQEQEQARREEEARRKHLAPLCQQARERMRILDRPFVYVDEEGNQRDSLPAEAKADRAKTQQWIDEHCDNY